MAAAPGWGAGEGSSRIWRRGTTRWRGSETRCGGSACAAARTPCRPASPPSSPLDVLDTSAEFATRKLPPPGRRSSGWSPLPPSYCTSSSLRKKQFNVGLMNVLVKDWESVSMTNVEDFDTVLFASRLASFS